MALREIRRKWYILPMLCWYNEQVELGFNYRMTDFQAALLLEPAEEAYTAF